MGNHVFLKVMPKRGVVRFGKCGKLSLRYIEPFEVLERVGTISYRLVLSPKLLGVHAVFHVFMLQKYTPGPTHVMDWGELVVEANGAFQEGPMRIMDSQDQVLRRKTVRLVNVVTPEPGSTRMASPNRNPGDARLFLFQKCRDPNPWLDPNGGSEPEPGLLRCFHLS